jgi:carboxylesterase type B
MFGDRGIVQGVHAAMQYHSSLAPTYGYLMNYDGDLSILKNLFLRKKDFGISHTDELLYLLNSTTFSDPLVVGTKDYKFSETFIKLWTTFADTWYVKVYILVMHTFFYLV